MASRPMVTLTFAGESSDLERTFDRVGESSRGMAQDVESSTSAFDRATEASDRLDTRAMGFRDTITGVQDSVSGFSRVLKGDFSGDALFTAGAGVGDLASGFTNLLGPALGRTVRWLAQTRVGMLAQAAATKVVTAAQWLWNVAMSANPIGLIIVAIIALIGIIVLIATKTDWFQRLWTAIWSVIGDPVKAVWAWIRDTLWPGIQMVWEGIVAGAKFVWEGVKHYFGLWKSIFTAVIGWIGDLWDRFTTGFNRIVDFVRGLPARIRTAASGMWNGIRDAFRNAVNWIIDRWNGLSFTLPSVEVFGQTIGGGTLSTPNIPRLHSGGVVPGAPGQEVLTMLQAGERVTPAGRSEPRRLTAADLSMPAGGGIDQMFLTWLEGLLRTNGLALVEA